MNVSYMFSRFFAFSQWEQYRWSFKYFKRSHGKHMGYFAKRKSDALKINSTVKISFISLQQRIKISVGNISTVCSAKLIRFCSRAHCFVENLRPNKEQSPKKMFSMLIFAYSCAKRFATRITYFVNPSF